jgi:glutathione synthase/RimK-type ligase-like ATP-grasp enzyme
LPPHQLVINTIGDADLCRTALEAAIKIAAKTTARVINQPSNVLLTGRIENADRLGRIPGVVTPKMALLPRTVLEDSEAVSLLARQGFTFPLLLRSPGFHTGHFFERVQDEKMLAAHLSQMPGEELMVIQYLDARSRDGKIRKYRVMMIDGVLYPLHAAISHEWKIHYFTAEMADNAKHRAEDAAFLDNMPRVLGDRAMEALSEICSTLGLDYGGIDFSVSGDGKILLFEANATMVVLPTDKDARWDYRRPAVQRILDAVQRLLTRDRAAG